MLFRSWASLFAVDIAGEGEECTVSMKIKWSETNLGRYHDQERLLPFLDESRPGVQSLTFKISFHMSEASSTSLRIHDPFVTLCQDATRHSYLLLLPAGTQSRQPTVFLYVFFLSRCLMFVYRSLALRWRQAYRQQSKGNYLPMFLLYALLSVQHVPAVRECAYSKGCMNDRQYG